jgi:hypothetical protein
MRALRAAGATALGVVVILLGGCGVGLQDVAEPLPSGALRTATPAPSESITTRETAICFVNGRTLERVSESITGNTPDGVMLALAAGPPAKRQGDLRTLLLDPLTAEPVLSVAGVTSSGELVVRYKPAFLQLPATDQFLLVGQVVCSMAGIGIDQVLLTDPMGQPALVPLPDGRAREGRVTLDDYRSLITEP